MLPNSESCLGYQNIMNCKLIIFMTMGKKIEVKPSWSKFFSWKSVMIIYEILSVIDKETKILENSISSLRKLRLLMITEEFNFFLVSWDKRLLIS